ncbi:MAG: formylglycine-generating enzyme family protein [Azoarcus sp.]|jgi:formylglycine-generating enzyme required for sulfatase activity|nr:formylglycine-generating enzyme family protein [Azoarcus sp.]
MTSGLTGNYPVKPPLRTAAIRTIAVAALLVCASGCVTSPENVTNTFNMEFVLVQPGIFMMGCSEGDTDCLADGRPQHPVKISQAFYLGKFEVTQTQWTALMGNNPSRFKGDNRPVENVSWNDAHEFIRRMNALEGTNKYRLPTEAEWEYAARAGVATKFPFDAARAGNHAWYWNNANRQTHPVGEKQPNPWGLHDMHGNVWEWVQDWYGEGYYASSMTSSPGIIVQPKEILSGPRVVISDPKGAAEGAARVLRGGSWGNDLRYLRSAHRNAYPPDYRSASTGFRLAVSPDSDWLDNVKTMKKQAEKDAASRAEAVKKAAEPPTNAPEIKAPDLPSAGPFGTMP